MFPTLGVSINIVARQATTSSDVVNDTTAPHTLAVVGSLTGFATLIVGLRVYVRALVLRRFGTDDYIIVLALICAIGVLACFIGESYHGLGRYTQFIGEENLTILGKWLYFHAIVIVVGISAVKISLGFFLFRFAARSKFRKFIIAAIVFLVAFTVACAGTLIFQCIPIVAAWEFSLRPQAKCFSADTYTAIGLFNSAINIATDVIFATLPIPMFYNVQVNKKTKFSLMFILSLGYLACAAAIIKAVAQAHFFDTMNGYRDNHFTMWNDIELNVGILAASLPTLKPLVKSAIESTRTFTSGRKHTGDGYYVRQGLELAMHSLHARGHGTGGSRKYNVHVSAARRSLSRRRSVDSEQALYPTQTGDIGYGKAQGETAIMRTTEVIVQRDPRSGTATPRFGSDNWI